jgi:hypothetical protein
MCKYQNVFGVPRKGLHSYRIFDLAIVDVLLTIGGAIILHLWLPSYSFPVILFWLFLLGVLLHRMFCVRTTIDRWLFS